MDPRRRRDHLQVALIVAGAVAAATACDFTQFDALADDLPTQVITQDGDISRTFPVQILGLPPRGAKGTGATILAAGSGASSLMVAAVDSRGERTIVQRELSTLSGALGRFEIQDMAADPAPATARGGPYAWIGLTLQGSPGRIARVDTAHLDRPPAVTRAPPGISGVQDFGASVASARLGGGGGGDLAIGAAGAVILWRGGTTPGTRATGASAAIRARASAWPARQVTAVTAGALDPRTALDEIALSIPEGDVVAVVHGIGACFQKPSADCTTILAIPRPASAGAGTDAPRTALLIGDVDGDGLSELVVGAPGRDGGRGAVDIYDLAAGHFDGSVKVGQPRALAPPKGARAFGSSLALAAVGDSTRPLLIVGAPDSAWEGSTRAGIVFLFDATLGAPVSTVALASPKEDTRLGHTVGAMPFVAGGRTAPLLIAGTQKGVVIFFAGVTAGQRDRRVR